MLYINLNLLILSLIITGMHTMKNYGETYKEIVKDGFKPYFIIETKQHNTEKKDILNTMSNQFKKSYQIVNKINPDMVIVLGDRYDMYPLALTAHIMGIPWYIFMVEKLQLELLMMQLGTLFQNYLIFISWRMIFLKNV